MNDQELLKWHNGMHERSCKKDLCDMFLGGARRFLTKKMHSPSGDTLVVDDSSMTQRMVFAETAVEVLVREFGAALNVIAGNSLAAKGMADRSRTDAETEEFLRERSSLVGAYAHSAEQSISSNAQDLSDLLIGAGVPEGLVKELMNSGASVKIIDARSSGSIPATGPAGPLSGEGKDGPN